MHVADSLDGALENINVLGPTPEGSTQKHDYKTTY